MATTRTDESAPADRPHDERHRPRFDPSHIELTCIDLTDFDVVRAIRDTVGTSGSVAARAAELAKDATYVTVGLGLLGYQRAQVRRREFERSLRR